MRLFFSQKHSIVHYFFIVLSICLFSKTNVYATDTSVTHSIHIEWTYDTPEDAPLIGFRLYQENISVCQTINPAKRSMDCQFESPTGTFHFYLAAYSEESESPLSAPFLFTLQTPAGPVADIAANIAYGATPLTVILDAGDSQGDITSYLWSFGDGSGSAWTDQNTITHTYYTTGQHSASVTVIDSEQNTDSKSIIIDTTPQIIPANLGAPIATIEIAESEGIAPFSVSFDGLESTAGSVGIIDYIWNFNDKSPTIHGATPVHTYSTPGTYHPILTVVNSLGILNSTSVTIVVTSPSFGNTPPNADFTTSVIQLDDILVIELDACPSTDPDGVISNYDWTLCNTSYLTGPSITHTFPANKVCTIALTVTDNDGAKHTKTSSTITFLKEIHANVIFLINSFLLNNNSTE